MEKWDWMALGVQQLLVFRARTYSNWWPFNLSFIFWFIDFQVSRWRCQWQWFRRRQCRWRRWWARAELKYRIWKSRGREVWRIQAPEKGWCSQSKVYGALPNFKGNESRDPSSVPSPKQKPNIVVVVGKQLQSINFMLFFNNPIFLRKFPLIKLQRFWRTGQAKINNSSKYHSMARSILGFHVT